MDQFGKVFDQVDVELMVVSLVLEKREDVLSYLGTLLERHGLCFVA